MIQYFRELAHRFEGLHRVARGLVYPYICPAGYPTRGYGFLVKDMKVPPITVPEAEAEFETKAPAYFYEAAKVSPVLWLAPPKIQAAIADFCFNLGVPRYRGSTLRKRVEAQDWDGACAELPKWVFGGGRKLPGLVARRAAEVKLIKEATDETTQ
jgi:lysozyme